jgi:hypothetical protein
MSGGAPQAAPRPTCPLGDRFARGAKNLWDSRRATRRVGIGVVGSSGQSVGGGQGPGGPGAAQR